MKREARQAVHSVYRLLSGASLRLTYRRKEEEAYMPVPPPAWASPALADALSAAARAVAEVAESVAEAEGKRSSGWLYVKALQVLLEKATEMELSSYEAVASEYAKKEGGEA